MGSVGPSVAAVADNSSKDIAKTRAAVHDKIPDQPRLPKTPACAQAARWWPRESNGRPPSAETRNGDRRRWKRRNNNTRKRCTTEKTQPPPELPWREKNFLVFSQRWQNVPLSVELFHSTCRLVLPDLRPPGSNTFASRSGGRALKQLPTSSHNQHGDCAKKGPPPNDDVCGSCAMRLPTTPNMHPLQNMWCGAQDHPTTTEETRCL